ncbi:MAG: hypothetical protein P0S96_02950 [Simkaniaceae bacterium]|nr:hypothetical protein [Candidatus Sacchlamyda saccharinae]
MRYVSIAFFVLMAVFAKLDRHFFKSNDSFCPKFIFPNWSRLPQLSTKPRDVSNILSQRFRYLTKGKQSFVFLSEDGKWVLKLPRLPRAKMRYALHFDAKKPFFENALLHGKSIYEELEKETGVVYAHLKPSQQFNPVLLIDQYGQNYSLDPNDLPFFLQKRGEDFFTFFAGLKDPTTLIEKTISLFSSLYDKGFIDRDPILDKNFGVIDGSPFIMDIGQLEKCDHLPSRREYLEEMTQSLAEKLQRESPDLYKYYKKLLH